VRVDANGDVILVDVLKVTESMLTSYRGRSSVWTPNRAAVRYKSEIEGRDIRRFDTGKLSFDELKSLAS
jgi:hypothetical protein